MKLYKKWNNYMGESIMINNGLLNSYKLAVFVT